MFDSRIEPLLSFETRQTATRIPSQVRDGASTFEMGSPV